MPSPVKRRDRDDRHALDLRQQMVDVLAQRRKQVGLPSHQIPFVDRDHQCARPSRSTRSAMRRSCSSNALLRVHQNDHDFGEANGAQRVGDGELLEFLLDARAAAQAGGVEKIGSARPCQSRSTAMESRVVPASALVSSRSSPSSRLISVDLPALGRPTMATRMERLEMSVIGRGADVVIGRTPPASASVPASTRAARRRDRSIPRRARPRSGPDRPGRAHRPRSRPLSPACLRSCWRQHGRLAGLAGEVGEGAIGRRQARRGRRS